MICYPLFPTKTHHHLILRINQTQCILNMGIRVKAILLIKGFARHLSSFNFNYFIVAREVNILKHKNESI